MSSEPAKAFNIQLLPPQLANQIAAGEVVERPASVVKELIENSIDAKADSIHIDIEQGGHKRILIRDTGTGIAKEQLELALSRHATSKIRDIGDLECITSMGFRGEALASISSVSRLTLTSRPQEQSQAWEAKAEGLDMAVTLSPAAHPLGTSIEVVDLFFNTPARRKFLRAQKTEFQHIESIVRRIALAHPQVAFVLKHNGKVIHKWSAGDLTARVSAICGQSFLRQCTAVDYHHEDIHLSGWCSNIGEGWQTNDQQFIFVNQRMIRDKLALHAIRQAYEGMLPDNQYPAYVLFLSLPAENMDINVHPAKHEVRFHEARQVHDVIFQAISQAIVSAQAISEKADFNPSSVQATASKPSHDYIRPLQDTDLPTTSVGGSTPSPAESYSALQRSQSSVTRSASGSRNSNLGNFGRATEAHISEAGRCYQELMQGNETDINTDSFVRLGLNILFEQNDALVVLPLSSIVGLGYEKDIANASTSQPLLMPVSVAQSKVSQQSAIDQLKAIGCLIESRNQKFILKQVPSAIRSLPWAHIFARLLEQTHSIESESRCLALIAHYYLEITRLNTATIQTIIANLDPKKLGSALNASGQIITEKMLLSLTKVAQND